MPDHEDHPTVHEIRGEDGEVKITMIHVNGDPEEAATAIRECYATYHEALDEAIEFLVEGNVVAGMSRLKDLADTIYHSVNANMAFLLRQRAEDTRRQAKNN